MKYLIVIEETGIGFSAFSPDLEGCVATGASRKEVEKAMKEAIDFHIDGLKQEGCEIPKPHTFAEYLEISA